MDVDSPPEPPDPDGSPPRVTPDATRQAASSRKRPIENDQPVADSGKKTVTDPSQSIPSIQNIYTHPTLTNGPTSYIGDDKGPYVVHVSRETSDPSAGITIRALKFGQFLHTHKFENIMSDGVKSVGRNRISVQFLTAQAANNFLISPVLPLTKYVAVIPTFNITRMGLVRGVPVDWSMEEFVESISLPTGCGVILKARRLNRKTVNDGNTEWVPTQSVVVTFRGQMLPNRIFSYYTSLPVEPYKFPTIQCLNCCRFGHIKTQCRSTPRCFRCSQPHAADTCEVSKDKATCLHCSGSHFASDKDCPEFLRQQNIKLVMSQEFISYSEASSRFPPVRRSYAEMTREMFSTPVYSPRPANPNRPINSKNSQPPKSYRETVFRTPRPRAPLAKGYEKQAHQDIINNPSSSLPNGCAIGNNPTNSSSEGKMLENLSALLLSIIAPCSDIPLPPNVAHNLSQIFKILNNGSNSSSSMEL